MQEIQGIRFCTLGVWENKNTINSFLVMSKAAEQTKNLQASNEDENRGKSGGVYPKEGIQ